MSVARKMYNVKCLKHDIISMLSK